VMEAKGLADRVHARHFHKWCRDELLAFGQDLPAHHLNVGEKMDEMVQRVIYGVDRKHIPSGQYQAVLIDEGHDFQPEWLKLVAQMVDPTTNSLLLLYDDAQSIYERSRSKQFSFKSVGVQAQGRTTILKINYRNTKQILQTASLIAADLLTADDKDEDGIPLVKPISCGREGEAPLIIRLPNMHAEASRIAELLRAAHQQGHAWGDMAVICRHGWIQDDCAKAMTHFKLPHQVRRGAGTFDPQADTIKVLTMHASKGLEFAVVALMGVGQMPASGEDERDEARLFYVGATRATQRLLITASGNGKFCDRLKM
jgi:superfamily I DNA/RNA helicase